MRLLRMLLAVVFVTGMPFAGQHLAASFFAEPADQAGDDPDDEEATDVQTVQAEVRRFSTRVRAVGSTRAHRAIELRPEDAGLVTRIHFEPGEHVEESALLLELDARSQIAALNAAEATLTEAQTAFDRLSRLHANNATSRVSLDEAEAALLRAASERDIAAANLANRSVTAPFAGRVGLSGVTVGARIEANAVIATLDDTSTIQVDFHVPENLMTQIEIGQQVHLTSSAWPDRTFEGRLTAIDGRVDHSTRSLAVRAEIDNSDGVLTGGMFVRIEVLLDDRESPAVPEYALTVEGMETLLHVLRDGTIERVTVEAGDTVGGHVEILQGIAVGEDVIVTNFHRVEPGMPAQRLEAARRQTLGDQP
ncbi:efflux RND transporter periplasmic adaptor subunit [Aureimonas populi]|uniref:Efflux RND transporter periplasmic adaptor subunit n=1 Tax=Aureimonas populi TaxID=1701758 RepID=A0ABW5CK87_9HYPH|nr:efflux RND transporter periplasmic adaptor subunit [Aureimonas populi]